MKPIRLNILLVDDEANIRKTLTMSLHNLGCQVDTAPSVDQALALLEKQTYDLVLTDNRMEGKTGSDLIREVKTTQPQTLLVMMTAYSSIEHAVSIIQEGAFDYLAKPFTTAQLEAMLRKAESLLKAQKETEELKEADKRQNFFSGMQSVPMKKVEELVRKTAASEATILLSGESGTGKSQLARLIHDLSPRAKNPFITVYCTTLTESLIESELFGHVKGSFTGASQDKTGKLEIANDGSLFLDEIGDLSASGQGKLLRFLQDRVFEKVGGNKEITVNTRVIAATNKNLSDLVVQGKFREDLYYRINILECHIPPLREHKEDLPTLIQKIYSQILADQTPPQSNQNLPEPILKILTDYSWPGNIRELRNTLERLVLLSSNGFLNLEDLPETILHPKGQTILSPSESSLKTLEDLEKNHIQKILSQEKSFEKAAEVLGITTVTLWRKRKEYGL